MGKCNCRWWVSVVVVWEFKGSGFTEPLNPCAITLKVYGIDDLAKISGSLENMQILRHKQRIHKYQWLQAVSMACDSMGMRALIIAKLVISSKKWHHLLCSFRIVFWKPPFTGHWLHRILPVPHGVGQSGPVRGLCRGSGPPVAQKIIETHNGRIELKTWGESGVMSGKRQSQL